MTDVAAFDFDGTISRRDTLVPFLAKAAGPSRFAAACSRLGLLRVGRRIAPGDRDAAKENLIAMLLTGRREDDLIALGERYARDLLTGDRIRPEMVERIHEHRRAGHRTVIVSASLVYYLEPIARELSMDGVIGVEPEVVDDLLTGRLSRPNVRAHEKAVRLREWLDAAVDPGVGPGTGIRLHAYGNSSGDHALLEMADRSWWLGRPGRVPSGSTPFRAPAPLT